MRRTAALLIAVGLTALVALFPGTASAFPGPGDPPGVYNPTAGGDCKGTPTVADPSGGVAGMIDAGPQNPRDGDPFAAKPTSTVYEQYGWGPAWSNYDLGCGPDGSRDPGDIALGAAAGIALSAVTFCAAILAAAMRFAFNPDTVAVLNPIVRIGTKVFGDSVFVPLFGLAAMAAAIWMAVRAHRARLSAALTDAAWVVAVAVIAGLAVSSALTIAPAVDKAVTGSVAALSTAIGGQTSTAGADMSTSVSANLDQSIVYRTWLAGEFGKTDSDTARKYGPDLYAASTLSRAQARLPADQRAKIVKDKQKQFKTIASKVQDSDPDAYSYIAGHSNNQRLDLALLGLLALACAAGFILLASLLLLFSLVVLRLALIVIPLLAPIGAFPPTRAKFFGVIDYAAGALATAVIFGAVSAVMTVVIGGILGSDTNMFLAALLILVVSVALFALTKPLRRIKGLGGLAKLSDPKRNGHYRERSSSDQSFTGDNDPPGMPAPGDRPDYSNAVPAEAVPGFFARTGRSTAQGAAAVAAGVVTGGAAVAGMAAAAVKGGATAGVAESASTITGSSTVGLAAGTAAGAGTGKALGGGAPRSVPALPAAGTARTGPAEGTPTTGAVPPVAEPPVEVYRPGEAASTGHRPVASFPAADNAAYAIYTPPSAPAEAGR